MPPQAAAGSGSQAEPAASTGEAAGVGLGARNRSICCSEGPGVKGGTAPGRAAFRGTGVPEGRGNSNDLRGNPSSKSQEMPPTSHYGTKTGISCLRLTTQLPAFQKEQM